MDDMCAVGLSVFASSQPCSGGITITCKRHEFFTDKWNYTLVDCSGHRDFIKSLGRPVIQGFFCRASRWGKILLLMVHCKSMSTIDLNSEQTELQSWFHGTYH